MEFRYRAGDRRPKPEEESSQRHSSFTAAVSHPGIQGVQPSVQLMTDEMLHRELEKARVWQEILMEEIERRRVLMREAREA